MTSTLVFLAMNGYVLVASNDEMLEFALAIAASEPDMSWKEIARWLRDRTYRPLYGSDSVRALRQRLPPHWGDPARLRVRIDEYLTASRAVAGELASAP